jgi:hypothetical protein
MKPDLRQRALKAYRLSLKNITGEELAARMKCGRENASLLVNVGALISVAEAQRLTEREWQAMKAIARTVARFTMLVSDSVLLSDVDFAAGRRRGWCRRAIEKRLITKPNTHAPGWRPLCRRGEGLGLLELYNPYRVRLTAAGWAFVWEAGLIKPNWKVPL